MKVYISGQITGLSYNEARIRFEKGKYILEQLGYTVINPFNNGLKYNDSWENHMKKDIEMLYGCDAIFMLDNWISSVGANIEYNISKEKGFKVFFENDFKFEKMNIKDAISVLTQMEFKYICDKTRERKKFYARMIYTNYMYNRRPRAKIEDIARELNKNKLIPYYYLKKYKEEMKYNKEFRELCSMVDYLLK